MDKTILFVHGANATPLTFNYIKQNLPRHKEVNFIYDSNKDIETHVENLAALVTLIGEEVSIVAHSLGGVIAIGATYRYHPTKLHPLKTVTISSPFAGSKVASFFKWVYPGYGLFNNVAMSNPVIGEIQENGAVEPSLNIITTGGEIPLIKEPNDGVVAVSSQMSLMNCEEVILRLNHFEVLLSPTVVETIRKFVWS
jgi:pimeloyl-ACP methyl ester carboxylesterase